MPMRDKQRRYAFLGIAALGGDCGFVVEPGNVRDLADLLQRLAADRRPLPAMGKAARALLDAQFTRARALDSWRRLMDELAPAATKP
jgi:glycosyltransferase involved in cell wall biosynthesis